LAWPFFQREDTDGAGNKSALNAFELYHKFMQVYPAYTIERIEDELSWREVGKLIECWRDGESNFKTLCRIEDMIKKQFGFNKVSSRPLHGDELLNKLTEEGML